VALVANQVEQEVRPLQALEALVVGRQGRQVLPFQVVLEALAALLAVPVA
jgi:hypothetical protein